MLKYWLWLSSLRGVGPVASTRLLERFGTPRDVYFAASAQLSELSWLGATERKALADKSMDAVERILEACEEKDIRIFTLQDSQYTERLRNIYDPPLVLYVRGTLPDMDNEAAVAMVGSREATMYGLMTAEKLAAQVTEHGGLIVSGLAKGIDAASHKGALRAGGRTVAVLGCGVDVVFPKENEQLYEDVISAGAIISEYPPGSEPLGMHFPQRNRIISGLSLAVVVVEATRRSGALITAALAADQGREVFAVPGNVDVPQSAGCLSLLREGANIASSGWDIVRDFVPLFPGKLIEKPRRKGGLISESLAVPEEDSGNPAVHRAPPPEISEEERLVYDCLGEHSLLADEISDLTGLQVEKVLSALTVLESAECVIQEPGDRFRRA